MEPPEEKPRPPKAEDPAPRDDIVVGANRCPFCRDDVRGPTTDWVACAGCLARHHEPCWGEGGGRCAACGHGERLRADPAPTKRRPPLLKVALVTVATLFAVIAVGIGSALSARRREFEKIHLEMLAAQRAQAEAEARQRAEPAPIVDASVDVGPPITADARFDIARRVDELRELDRSGSRKAARRGRRKAAWKQARIDLAMAMYDVAPDEVVRFKAALKRIDELDPPPRGPDAPVESILEEQDEYLMPPHPAHAEFAAFTERMRGRAQLPGYTAHLLVVTGDATGALAEANHGLDRAPTDWLNWLARGEALLALGDARGAAMALTISEGFSAANPTWALLAQIDLARARGDRKAELAAAWDALEVGQVPDWGGHLEALLERIATLEHELGERR